MTIAEQLTGLKNIQLNLRTAIEGHGVTVGAAPFIEYPALAGSIGSSGFEPVGWDGETVTIQDKLAVLKQIQRDLRTAIEANGVTVGAAPFADYPVLISNIGPGGYDPDGDWSGEGATWGGGAVTFGDTDS